MHTIPAILLGYMPIVCAVPVVLRFNVQNYVQSVRYTFRTPKGALQAAPSRFRDVDMFKGVRF